MSAPSRCIAAATRGLQSNSSPRVTQRTFASHTSNPVASSRKATAGNTTCLRELQRTQQEAGRAANSVQGQTRTFSQSTSRSKLKTIDQIRARNKGGVCLYFSIYLHGMRGNRNLWPEADLALSHSTSQQPSSSWQPAEDYGPTSPTRKSAWHGSG
jgi:hypothetical protein